jgi:two-component system response regulator PilR (NtrC family)
MVDDDRLFCRALADALEVAGVALVVAHSVAAARARCGQGFSLAILDNDVDGENGLSLVPELTRANPEVRVILCTAFPALDNAVTALRLGLYDYFSKPVDPLQLVATIRRALDAPERNAGSARAHARPLGASSPVRVPSIVGASEAMEALRTTVAQAGRSRAPVLITGETGTGKSLVARALHAQRFGDAADAPFVAVNCAALPAALVESELFGSERGSFTGAHQSREGLFEQANGGTLFLDELGELEAPIQAKLLTALEEGWIRRVGGGRVRRFDARVVAATNVEVERAVGSGSLRADLYYRLNVVRIDLPPLRARRGDLPALIASMLSELTDGAVRSLPDDELAALVRHDWPGNARELRNVLERALVLGRGEELRPSRWLAPSSAERPRAASGKHPIAQPPLSSQAPVTLAELERAHVLAALERCHGNRTQAARVLGLSIATLRRKLKEYDAA